MGSCPPYGDWNRMANISLQLQREAEALAQDSSRYLDASTPELPPPFAVHHTLFFATITFTIPTARRTNTHNRPTDFFRQCNGRWMEGLVERSA